MARDNTDRLYEDPQVACCGSMQARGTRSKAGSQLVAPPLALASEPALRALNLKVAEQQDALSDCYKALALLRVVLR